MRHVRRLTRILPVTFLLLAVSAPAALAQASGEGTYGAASDKTITNTAFILIAAIPLFILCMSLLQGFLDRRKDARKKAAKHIGGDSRWSGGW